MQTQNIENLSLAMDSVLRQRHTRKTLNGIWGFFFLLHRPFIPLLIADLTSSRHMYIKYFIIIDPKHTPTHTRMPHFTKSHSLFVIIHNHLASAQMICEKWVKTCTQTMISNNQFMRPERDLIASIAIVSVAKHKRTSALWNAGKLIPQRGTTHNHITHIKQREKAHTLHIYIISDSGMCVLCVLFRLDNLLEEKNCASRAARNVTGQEAKSNGETTKC